MNPARFFTWASLAFGLLLVLVTPPFCTPDEPAHFYRAWSVAQGHFILQGGDMIPRSIVVTATAMLRLTRGAETGQVTLARLWELTKTPLRERDAIFVPVVRDPGHEPLAYTAPNYTPVGYAATAPVMILGKLLHLPPIVILYSGRLANLLVATLILAWAISVMPTGRWTLALLALTPMAVFMRGSLAIDALTFACALALIAAIVTARPGAAIALSFVVAAIKPGYAIIPLLALAIPKLRRRAIVIGILIAILAGTGLTILFARAGEPIAPIVSNRVTGVLHAPATFASGMAHEIRRDARLMMIETVADFGWLDAPAPFAFAVLWLSGLLIVALIDGRSPLPPAARAWSLVLFVAGIAAILTLLHLSTITHDDFLLGLQGRYFLPLLPLLLLPLAVTAINETTKAHITQFLVAVGVVQSLWVVVTRYWV